MPRALLAAQSLLLAVFVTWPMALRPGSAALGSPNGDALKHVWNLWWMQAEWRNGVSGLHTVLINFPNGIELYPIELANGLLTAWTPLPPILAANLLALLHVVLVGLAAGWLGWLLSERKSGALAAGALAQVSAFTAFTLHAGVGELRLWWWIPLGLALVVRARSRQSPRDFVLLGLALAAATLSCFYHGFFLAAAVATYALATLKLERRLLLGYAGAAALGLVIVVPVVRTFAHTYDPGAAHAAGSFFTYMQSGYPKDSYAVSSLRPLELFTPDLQLSNDPHARLEAYLGGRYLGFGAILLAIAALRADLRRALPWLAVAAVGVMFALGNTLVYGGRIRWILPLSPVNHVLSWFAEPLNFPVRFLAVTTVAVAALGAIAVRERWVWVLVPLTMIDVTLNDPVPWPRSSFFLPAVDDLQPPPGAVADLTWAEADDLVTTGKPVLATFDAQQRSRSAAAQVMLDRPFATIPIERVDHWATDGLAWTAATPLARVLGKGHISSDALSSSAALYRARGFGSVLVTHPCDGGAQQNVEGLLTMVLGEPQRGRCGSLWTLPEGDAPPDLAQLQATVEADAARLHPPPIGDPDNGNGQP